MDKVDRFEIEMDPVSTILNKWVDGTYSKGETLMILTSLSRIALDAVQLVENHRDWSAV